MKTSVSTADALNSSSHGNYGGLTEMGQYHYTNTNPAALFSVNPGQLWCSVLFGSECCPAAFTQATPATPRCCSTHGSFANSGFIVSADAF